MGQNTLSVIGSSIWNKTQVEIKILKCVLPNKTCETQVLKKTNSINTFKHNLI